MTRIECNVVRFWLRYVICYIPSIVFGLIYFRKMLSLSMMFLKRERLLSVVLVDEFCNRGEWLTDGRY